MVAGLGAAVRTFRQLQAPTPRLVAGQPTWLTHPHVSKTADDVLCRKPWSSGLAAGLSLSLSSVAKPHLTGRIRTGFDTHARSALMLPVPSARARESRKCAPNARVDNGCIPVATMSPALMCSKPLRQMPEQPTCGLPLRRRSCLATASWRRACTGTSSPPAVPRWQPRCRPVALHCWQPRQ